MTALRYALLDLCTEQVTKPAVHAIFDLVHRDLAAGKRDINDTVMVLSQFRPFVKIDRKVAEQLLQFEMEVSLGRAGEATAELGSRVSGWLERFRGAAENIV